MVMYLGADDIRVLLDWEPLIAAMETALADFSLGHAIQPVREMLTIEEGRRYLGVMPAVTVDAMGAKLVSFYPGNAGSGIPTHHAMILLFRTDTGEPLAVMDGRLITEMRTAAVSAAATKHLARADSRVLALLGSGVQAEAHLHALQGVRSFDEIRVWSRTAEHAQRFADRHQVQAMSAEDAVREADVVVTVTSAVEPILKGAWLKPGSHVNAVGAPRPTWRELDDTAMANVLVVDSRAAVSKESGDVILSKAEISAEIGEIFAGRASVPAEATTIFKSVGIAVEDIAAARLAYQAAVAREDAVTPDQEAAYREDRGGKNEKDAF
jgi:thiomorpholine-carboxylate dehydrogenase